MKLQGSILLTSTLTTREFIFNISVSCGTAWALFALAQEPRVQAKLREELLTVDTDNPTMDQLIALPYLDMVVREVMRLHAPVPATSKQAMKDDIIPLSKPVVDRKGRIHHNIRHVQATIPQPVPQAY